MGCAQRFHFFSIAVLLLAGPSPRACAAEARTYRYHEESEVIRSADGRIRGAASRANKDFVIGGLFALHSQGVGEKCGEILRDDNELMEAMLFALDTINADSQLLRGINLGYDIRDTCFSETIGLDEALDLIVPGDQFTLERCMAYFGGNSSANLATVGVVGAYASRVSIPVAGLGRLFQMPQVSYASSSPVLNNRERYSYFYRTTTPDNILAEAIVDLMLWFNWTHISTVYSNDAYGQAGIAELQELAKVNEICIDIREDIDEDFLDDDYQRLATKLNASTANVVVLFAHAHHTQRLLKEIRRISPERRYIWITTVLSKSIIVDSKFNETAGAIYGVITYVSHVLKFHDYLTQLTIHRNKRNPWFPEIYANYAGCNTTLNATNDFQNACDQHSNITRFEHYRQSTFAALTIDAVYTFANALDRFLLENCDQPTVWNHTDNRCNGQKRQLNGSALREYIADVQFYSPLTGNTVQFDSEGNVNGRSDIWNYNSRFGLFKAGIWDSSAAGETRSGINVSGLRYWPGIQRPQ